MDLAKEFPNEKFVMIMPKSSDVVLWKKIFDESKKIKNLKLIEKVPFNKIQKYFNKAKVFVNTSESEGFQNTFIQACIAKTPILSLKINPDNFLNKFKCGLCCCDDMKRFKERLEKLLNNRKKYKSLKNNCLKYVKKNHDIKKIIGRWKDLLSIKSY